MTNATASTVAIADDLVAPIPRPPWSPAGNARDDLARRYIHGAGLEIGALYNPLRVPRDAQVTYLDRCDVAQQRVELRDHADLLDVPLVTVDRIDDVEALNTVEDESQDFVIANHLLEHTQDPLGTIRRHLQVLRPGGILFLGVPDKRFTFDSRRPTTPLDHLLRDHEQGPAWSLREHIEEWVRLVEGKEGDDYDQRLNELVAQGVPCIHFHVWTQHELAEMLVAVRRRLALPFDVEAIVLNPLLIESVAVLRKAA